jgi:hypothetical protein
VIAMTALLSIDTHFEDMRYEDMLSEDTFSTEVSP